MEEYSSQAVHDGKDLPVWVHGACFLFAAAVAVTVGLLARNLF